LTAKADVFVLSIIAKVRRIVNTILKTNSLLSGHFENVVPFLAPCVVPRAQGLL
jgi:hypothetical protein